MGFSRFVETGRVVLINYGPDAGKLATIVDILDAKKVLIDGPQTATGVHRQLILLKRVSLTDIVVTGLGKNCRQKFLVAAWKAQGIQAQWDKTAWATKIANKGKRAALSDFGRFKVMVAKKQKSAAVGEALAKMK
jgi:large subunit ribosomal protein L14e